MYETLVILALMAVCVSGLAAVASALFGEELFEKQTRYGNSICLHVNVPDKRNLFLNYD